MTDLECELYSTFDTHPGPILEFLQRLATSYCLPLTLHILDVGCGPGRMLKPFSDLGWRVTAMEPNRAFKSHAETLARRLCEAEVRDGGFNDISDEETFDLIVGINGSFAYLLTAQDRADAFARCQRALRPGGVLFLDLPNFLRDLKECQGSSEQVARRNGWEIRLIRWHEIDYHRATFTLKEEYRVDDAKGKSSKFRKDHLYAVTAFPDLSYLLTQAGFGNFRTFRSFEACVPQSLGPGRMMISAQIPA